MLFPKERSQKAHFAKKRAGVRTTERKNKAEARRRDGGSRWPEKHAFGRLEVAHYKDKGMGGDKDGSRSAVENLITLPYSIHQGHRSIHSGHCRVVPLTDRLMNGPCRFERRESIGVGYGPWRVVGVEVEVGVLV